MAIIDHADVRQRVAGGLPERQHAEARRDRWMMELERASLPAPAKHEQDAGNSGPRESAPPLLFVVPSLEIVPAEAVRTAAVRLEDAPVRAGLAAPQGANGYAPAEQVAANPVTAGADDAVQDQPQSAATGARAHHGHAAAVHRHMPGAAWFSFAQHGAAPGAIFQSLLATAAHGVAAQQGGAGAPASAAAPIRRSEATAITLPLPLGADIGETPAPAAGELASLDEAGGAHAPGATWQASEAYARKQLHVYRNNAGVQAWIRDADLSEAQARALVYAMSDELRGAGERLSALTVNGKTILSGPEDGDRPAGPGRLDDPRDRLFQRHLKANGAI